MSLAFPLLLTVFMMASASELIELISSPLVIHHDHCKSPMLLSPKTKKCECPIPYTKKGDSCICKDCVYNKYDESYRVAWSDVLPEYINEIYEEIDNEIEESMKTNGTASVPPADEGPKPKGNPNDEAEFGEDLGLGTDIYEGARLRRSVHIKDGNMIDQGESFGKQISRLRRFAEESESETPKGKKHHRSSKGKKSKGHTVTLSIVEGSINGNTSWGSEKAWGSLDSPIGTGALALGSGGGSAGSNSFNGAGRSNMSVTVLGAHGDAQAYIGAQSSGAAATSSILAGKGDAIAVNSVGERGVSSAAGFSTKLVAGAATSAFGPAQASLAATPGKGGASSAASYNQTLETSATVNGTGGQVAESFSAGDTSKDYHDLLKKKIASLPVQLEPMPMDFDAIFKP